MIRITEIAAKQIIKSLTKRGKGVGVRLGVKKSGCSGLSYVIEFCDTVCVDDIVFEEFGAKIIVDSSALMFLDGTEVDYEKKTLSEGFKFNNPNLKNQCGCGESFNT